MSVTNFLYDCIVLLLFFKIMFSIFFYLTICALSEHITLVKYIFERISIFTCISIKRYNYNLLIFNF